MFTHLKRIVPTLFGRVSSLTRLLSRGKLSRAAENCPAIYYYYNHRTTHMRVNGTLIIDADNIVLLSKQGPNNEGYLQGIHLNPPMHGSQPLTIMAMRTVEDNAPYSLIVQYNDRGCLLLPCPSVQEGFTPLPMVTDEARF